MDQDGWTRALRRLPSTFWYLWFGTLLNRAGSFVVVLLAFYLTSRRGLGPDVVGLVVGLTGAGGILGVLLGGYLADRWGRRRTLLLANAGTAGAVLALGWVTQPWSIAVAATAFGLTRNAVHPAYSAMMVDIVEPGNRIRAFNLNYWALNVGFSASALLGGVMAQAEIGVMFAVNAGVVLVTSLVIFLKVPESAANPVTHPTTPQRLGASPYRDTTFLVLVGLSFLSAMALLQYTSSLPLAMQRAGFGPADFGRVIAVNGVLIVCGQLFVPWLARDRDPSRLLALGAVLLGVGLGATALAHSLWLYALSVAVWTLGEMLQSPAIAALVADLSPARARGRYQGAAGLPVSAASFGAPILGGYVIGHAGARALWYGCLVVCVFVAVAHLVAAPRRRRRAVELAAAGRHHERLVVAGP